LSDTLRVFLFDSGFWVKRLAFREFKIFL